MFLAQVGSLVREGNDDIKSGQSHFRPFEDYLHSFTAQFRCFVERAFGRKKILRFIRIGDPRSNALEISSIDLILQQHTHPAGLPAGATAGNSAARRFSAS